METQLTIANYTLMSSRQYFVEKEYDFIDKHKERGKDMPEIIVDTRCEECDMHKTDIGTLVGIFKSIEEKFPTLEIQYQMELVNTFYREYKLDKRTEMIQGYKRTNIKEIRK